MPPRARPRKAVRDKRPAPDDAESSPAKRKKQPDDDSEVFTLSPEEQVKQLVLPGRNTFESCDKHAHYPWDKYDSELVITGCMHKCEVCGENQPRNLLRHIKTNHCYDGTGSTKNIPTDSDDRSVFWDIKDVQGPGKGGQKVFPLDYEDETLLIRAAQITFTGTADSHHTLNKSWLAKVNKVTMNYSLNPVTGKPGSNYVKTRNAEIKAKKLAAENKRLERLAREAEQETDDNRTLENPRRSSARTKEAAAAAVKTVNSNSENGTG